MELEDACNKMYKPVAHTPTSSATESASAIAQHKPTLIARNKSAPPAALIVSPASQEASATPATLATICPMAFASSQPPIAPPVNIAITEHATPLVQSELAIPERIAKESAQLDHMLTTADATETVPPITPPMTPASPIAQQEPP
jgi:hypothetical protein